MKKCQCGGYIVAYVKNNTLNVNTSPETGFKCEACDLAYDHNGTELVPIYPGTTPIFYMPKNCNRVTIDKAWESTNFTSYVFPPKDIMPSIPEDNKKWIKCSERLPAKDGRYLVTETWGAGEGWPWVGVCSFRQGKWDSHSVVAWQELPEAYKDDV